MTAETQFYQAAKIVLHQIEDASISVRTFGKGKPLVFIHGFMVHGYTWRKILPELAKNFTCYVIDLPGFGDSQWSKKTDFTFTAQARRLNLLFKKLNLPTYCIIAHDTGGTIARMVALLQGKLVEKLILINTEMPNHRPPYVSMYQQLAKLPFTGLAFKNLLKIDAFVKSPMLLREFYYDIKQFDNSENLAHYLPPIIQSKDKMFGMLSYLKGIEWKEVDRLKETHQDIEAKVLLVWGEKDKTFPIAFAEKMRQQFKPDCPLVKIPNACLMPHEEKPEEVLAGIVPFLHEE